MQLLAKPRIVFLVFVMASILSVSLFLFFFFFLHNHSSAEQSVVVQQACNATRFPDSCVNSLSGSKLSSNPEPVQIIQAAVEASQTSLETSIDKLRALQKSSTGNFNLTENVRLGLEALTYSESRINSTALAVPDGKIDLLNASNVFVFLYSGRELFLSDSSLFVDDAEVYDKYQREDESNATEEKVSMFPYMHVA